MNINKLTKADKFSITHEYAELIRLHNAMYKAFHNGELFDGELVSYEDLMYISGKISGYDKLLEVLGIHCVFDFDMDSRISDVEFPDFNMFYKCV